MRSHSSPTSIHPCHSFPLSSLDPNTCTSLFLLVRKNDQFTLPEVGFLLSQPFFPSRFSFSYSASVERDTASCPCLRGAEHRLMQHYQVRPAAKWTRQRVKSLLALVCNPSACSHSPRRLLPHPRQSITYCCHAIATKSSLWLCTVTLLRLPSHYQTQGMVKHPDSEVSGYATSNT